jgi:type IV pilus assembly protein PilA
MYCPKCGKPNSDTSQFCAACGQPLTAQTLASQEPVPGMVGAPPLTPPETSGKAIASLVCGLLSFILPAAIPAVILGHISRSEIRKSGGRLTGSGMALTGLVFGYLGVSVLPVLIIAAIAIPNLLRARIAANELSAVQAIRAIDDAEIEFAGAHPDIGYTCSLEDLSSASGKSGLLIRELAGGERHGYVLRIDGCTQHDYAVVAVPKTLNQTGVRAFCSTQEAVIRDDLNGSAQGCLEHGEELR